MTQPHDAQNLDLTSLAHRTHGLEQTLHALQSTWDLCSQEDRHQGPGKRGKEIGNPQVIVVHQYSCTQICHCPYQIQVTSVCPYCIT